MKVTVTEPAKITAEETERLLRFFLKKIVRKKIRKKLDIEVSFSNYDALKHMVGYCIQLDNKYQYKIWIRKSKSIEIQKQTLAHESVHIKQMVEGVLDPDTGKIKTNLLNGLKIENGDPYWDCPSEIEADGRIYGLLTRYHMKYG